MKTVLYKSSDRGSTKLDWLDSKHSFSFGEYYNPGHTHFGALRVLNDDIVEPGKGFGTHPHNNMEIISIVLEGALEHKDNMGSIKVIKKDDVQVMSAGKGILHSEYNHSNEEKVNFLQLWIFPDKKNIEPRYNQKSFPLNERLDQLKVVADGNQGSDALTISQDAKVILGNLSKNQSIDYSIKINSGIYVFVINGSLKISDNLLERKDALSMENADIITFSAKQTANFLIIEVTNN
ncbi:MAG: pirin family protein [Bacteroidetes bacterium]|nr:pirin family protein [Bacteroidota bacterium]